MKCPNCHHEIESSLTSKCPNCGFKFDDEFYISQANESEDTSDLNKSIDPDDYPTGGLPFIALILPLLGLLAIIFRTKNKPYTRKIYAIATIAGAVAWGAVLFLIFKQW